MPCLPAWANCQCLAQGASAAAVAGAGAVVGGEWAHAACACACLVLCRACAPQTDTWSDQPLGTWGLAAVYYTKDTEKEQVKGILAHCRTVALHRSVTTAGGQAGVPVGFGTQGFGPVLSRLRCRSVTTAGGQVGVRVGFGTVLARLRRGDGVHYHSARLVVVGVAEVAVVAVVALMEVAAASRRLGSCIRFSGARLPCGGHSPVVSCVSCEVSGGPVVWGPALVARRASCLHQSTQKDANVCACCAIRGCHPEHQQYTARNISNTRQGRGG